LLRVQDRLDRGFFFPVPLRIAMFFDVAGNSWYVRKRKQINLIA